MLVKGIDDAVRTTRRSIDIAEHGTVRGTKVKASTDANVAAERSRSDVFWYSPVNERMLGNGKQEWLTLFHFAP